VSTCHVDTGGWHVNLDEMIGNLAHVCNRGVEKRKIFLDEHDYSRFRDNLFLLNNVNGKMRSRERDIRNVTNLKREKLVEILKWSLLPNHYHLLLYELVEGGISEFTRRVGNAYTKYFNTKNEGRSGYLFQNKAKIIPILEEAQFLYIPFYIDLNSLDARFSNWKVNRPSDSLAIEFLKSYNWSSFRDYFGNGEYSMILNKELFYKTFDITPENYIKEISQFLTSAAVSTWQVDTVTGI